MKTALSKGGFDTSLIAFRENEEKDWEVREIIQRLGCFLKDRWKSTQPTQMYRSKGKALELFTADASSPEFERLYDVIVDVVTLPEFIQSEFSHAESKGRKFGALRASYEAEETVYVSRHHVFHRPQNGSGRRRYPLRRPSETCWSLKAIGTNGKLTIERSSRRLLKSFTSAS